MVYPLYYFPMGSTVLCFTCLGVTMAMAKEEVLKAKEFRPE